MIRPRSKLTRALNTMKTFPLLLAAGAHTLRFECTGKAEKSKGFYFGFDALTARVPVYARPASKDLRELQARREP